jgi:hypothetical protein
MTLSTGNQMRPCHVDRVSVESCANLEDTVTMTDNIVGGTGIMKYAIHRLLQGPSLPESTPMLIIANSMSVADAHPTRGSKSLLIKN